MTIHERAADTVIMQIVWRALLAIVGGAVWLAALWIWTRMIAAGMVIR